MSLISEALSSRLAAEMTRPTDILGYLIHG
jgi:hypothetical protein